MSKRSRSGSKRRRDRTKRNRITITKDINVLLNTFEANNEDVPREDIIDYKHCIVSHIGYGNIQKYKKSMCKMIHIGYNSSCNDPILSVSDNYKKCLNAINDVKQGTLIDKKIAIDFTKQGENYFEGETKPHRYFTNLERVFNQLNGSFFGNSENTVVQLDVGAFATNVNFGKLRGPDKGSLTVPFKGILHERIHYLSPDIIGMSLTKEVITELDLCASSWQTLVVFEKNSMRIQIAYAIINWPRLNKEILIFQSAPLQNPFGNLKKIEQEHVGVLLKNIWNLHTQK